MRQSLFRSIHRVSFATFQRGAAEFHAATRNGNREPRFIGSPPLPADGHRQRSAQAHAYRPPRPFRPRHFVKVKLHADSALPLLLRRHNAHHVTRAEPLRGRNAVTCSGISTSGSSDEPLLSGKSVVKNTPRCERFSQARALLRCVELAQCGHASLC